MGSVKRAMVDMGSVKRAYSIKLIINVNKLPWLINQHKRIVLGTASERTNERTNKQKNQ